MHSFSTTSFIEDRIARLLYLLKLQATKYQIITKYQLLHKHKKNVVQLNGL